jgi:hypothetical protein
MADIIIPAAILAFVALAIVVVSVIELRARAEANRPRLPMHPIAEETVWLMQLEPMVWHVNSPDWVKHPDKNIEVIKIFRGPIEIKWPEGEVLVYEHGRREGWQQLSEAMEAMRVSRFRNLVTDA